ncbi:MAG: hypothetical protein GY862_26940 [Gammaproteobacteria bacterium]|nr:hypothetical protein [Gammaproteobacteria bacterium]MCP5013830.1 hypothetical protein [Ketobacter sp.]
MAATVSLQTQRELQRWYKLKEHAVQLVLIRAIADGVRFPVVPAGRRSGKTERAKRFVAKMAMANPGEMYFIAAPTRDQVKKIYWQDMKKLCLSSLCSKKPSESDLTIFLDNGTCVQLIGLDRPERIEGVFWSGGVIDEIADIKPDAWEANIRPALDTFNPTRPNYKAWCWLIGVPDGLNHYYDMAQYAQNSGDPEWAYFHWKSSEILPAETIAAAKRQMSERQFKQEYEADFVGATGRIYEDYSKENRTTATIEPHEQLLWMHDQNYTPLSSAIGVRRGENLQDLYLLDEIVLLSAVSKQSAIEFVEKYKDHKNKHVVIYGDPAGKAGEKHGHASDYTDIEGVLKANNWRYTREVKPAHPSIKDRQNAVRAKVKTADGHRSLFVNPITAKWCDKGLSTVQLQKGSAFQEDQKNQYQHITTAIGYCVDKIWPINNLPFMTNLETTF